MTEQKALLVGSCEASLAALNADLADGWQVSSIVAQRVSTGGGFEARGHFLVILTRINRR